METRSHTKTPESNFVHHDFYNSENNIRDINRGVVGRERVGAAFPHLFRYGNAFPHPVCTSNVT